MDSRSPSQGRGRSRTRSPTPRSFNSRSRSRSASHSRSPTRYRRYGSYSRSPSRSRSPRRNGRQRSDSRSWSRERGRGLSRESDEGPLARSTKIVVERLTKNVNEEHLHEIFGEYGPITDLDLPINRTFGTNRGTAYILYDHEEDAESAIAHMHEAQIDGAVINVSIVLPIRKLSPPPPVASRGANIDPRMPFSGPRGNGSAAHGSSGRGGRRRGPSPSRYGPRSDVYRPGSLSVSRSRSPPAASGSRAGGNRYRSRSRDSHGTMTRSRSPTPRRKDGGRIDSHGSGRRSRGRSPSFGGRNESGSRSRSRSRA